LDRNGAIIKTYKFIDAYPTEVGSIELDYDTVNAIETFPITFQYNYWTSNTATGGVFGLASSAINAGVGLLEQSNDQSFQSFYALFDKDSTRDCK